MWHVTQLLLAGRILEENLIIHFFQLVLRIKPDPEAAAALQ